MKKIPKLRFKEFVNEWEEKKIENIGKIIGGGTPSSTIEEYWGGDIQWFTPTEVGKTKYVSKSIRTITELGLNKSSAKLLPKGTILLSSRATIGEKSISMKEVCTNQGFQSILVNKNNNNEFIYYLLDTLKGELVRQSSGSTFLEISGRKLGNISSAFPNIEEQKKIADFLSAVDVEIDLTNQKLELFEKYKKSIMKKIFNQELRFKKENGDNYPEWVEKKLEDIGNTYNGLIGKNAEDFGSGKKYITYKNIFDNTKIDIDILEFVDIKENEKQNKVEYGDIFFTVSSETPNEVGYTSILLNNINEDIYLNSFCFGYRIKNKKDFYLEFFRYLLRSHNFRKKIYILAQGSTRFNLSKIEVLKLKVKIPCLEEQQKIADFLSSIDNKIEKLSSKLEELKEFKKGLLQQMFV